MFKRISLALDGSDAAGQALAVALQLAQTERAELGICSVVDPIVIAGSAPPSPAMDLVVRDLESAARTLVNEAVEQARTCGVVASGHVGMGVPAFEFLRFARHFKADLIVMGTHGRRGLAHFFLGSVAETVLRESPIPVLVVRGPLASANQQQSTDDAERSEASKHRGGEPTRASA